MTEDATEVKVSNWKFNGVEYPLFAFDEPQVITLPNGSKHHFKKWEEPIEKKREDLLKTVIVTSPHLINGENPRDVKTDYTRSQLAYYEMMIDGISNVEVEGFAPGQIIPAQQIVPGVKLPGGKEARMLDLVGVPIRKAAAARLYGGRIEVEKPEVEEDEGEDFDPFADTPEISEEIEKQEKQKTLYKLTLERNVIVRQELGIETVNGRPTDPVQVIRFHMREPNGDDFSKWEIKGHRGYAVSLNKGGEKAERYYNLETMKSLFAALVEQIEGASINGQPIDLPADRDDPTRIALLAKVPLAIKKSIVATLFNEMSNLGNS